MPEHFGREECRRLLAESLRARPDIGLWNAMRDVALEPPDPFKPWGRRNFKKGTVFAVMLAVFVTAWFVYFNLWS